MSGQAVQLVLHVRRFRCQNRACPRQIFVEDLPEVVRRRARRTDRRTATFTRFAVAMSGQAGSLLLKRIGMAVSGDTLLRLAKQADHWLGRSEPENCRPCHAMPGHELFFLRRLSLCSFNVFYVYWVYLMPTAAVRVPGEYSYIHCVGIPSMTCCCSIRRVVTTVCTHTMDSLVSQRNRQFFALLLMPVFLNSFLIRRFFRCI